MTVFHPKHRANGQSVTIYHPSNPTGECTWQDADALATFIPEGRTPSEINGVSIAPVTTARDAMDWSSRARKGDFDEPDFEPPKGFKPAAGAVVLEPDGRVWLVHPTNEYAGYLATFPKGTVGKGGDLRETALREVFEESGLLVELVGYLTDSKRSLSYTRYYVARRIAGSPVEMGWESQAVSLVPLDELAQQLNQLVDHAIIEALREGMWHWSNTWLPEAKRYDADGHLVATQLSWKTLPMPDRHTTLAMDFTLNARQARRIQQGFIPVAMEQHWFAYFKHDMLFHHRSWSGILVYCVSFEPHQDGLRATSALVNRDPRQYGNTDDEEDRRLVQSLTIELSEAPPNELLKDPIAEGFAKAVKSDQYLGDPAVVTALLENFANLVISSKPYLVNNTRYKDAYQELVEENKRLSRIFSGEDPDYTPIGPWNSAEQLGQVVIRHFNLNADYLADENLPCILGEGFSTLNLKADTVTKAYAQDELRDWAADVVPRLQAIFEFAGTVLMGTHSVMYPGKTLNDFGLIHE